MTDTWDSNYGQGACDGCLCVDKDDDALLCQVLDGRERVTECPLWQEYVEFNEIRLLGPYWSGSKI